MSEHLHTGAFVCMCMWKLEVGTGSIPQLLSTLSFLLELTNSPGLFVCSARDYRCVLPCPAIETLPSENLPCPHYISLIIAECYVFDSHGRGSVYVSLEKLVP